MFDEKQRSEHDFFQYVAKSYKFFLAGDDYQSQAVDDGISQEAEERAEQIKARNQELQQVRTIPGAFDCLSLQIFCCRVVRHPLLG